MAEYDPSWTPNHYGYQHPMTGYDYGLPDATSETVGASPFFQESTYDKDYIRDHDKFQSYRKSGLRKYAKRMKYGKSLGEALHYATHPKDDYQDSTQLFNRLRDGFKGRGMYTQGMTGRGAYRRRPRYSRRSTRIRRYKRRRYGRGSYYDKLAPTLKGALNVYGKKSTTQLLRKAAGVAGGVRHPAFQGVSQGLLLAAQGSRQLRKSGMLGRGTYNNLFSNYAGERFNISPLNDEHDSVMISNREKICEIYGNDVGEVFKSNSFDLNPGNNLVFKKLAQYAANYKEYEFVQMVFCYETTLPSHYSTSSHQLGRVIMMTQTDVTKVPKSSFHEMEKVGNKSVGPLTDQTKRKLYHGVECAPEKMAQSTGLKHIRLRNETDKKSYDHGRFEFGVYNSDGAFAKQSIGELYVQYKVVLKGHREWDTYPIQEAQLCKWKPSGPILADHLTPNIRDNLGPGGAEMQNFEGMVTNQQWTHLERIFEDFSETAEIMKHSNIPFKCGTKIDWDGKLTTDADISSGKTLRYHISKRYFDDIPANQGGVTQGFECGTISVPVQFTFSSHLAGFYEICVRTEGFDEPLTQETTYNTSMAKQFEKEWNAELLEPTCSGMVTFQKDIVRANPTTFNSFNSTDVHTPNQNSWSVTHSKTSTEVRCHIKLEPALGQTGDNKVVVWVPVKRFWGHHSPGLFGQMVETEINLTDVQVRTYNATNGSTSGKPFMDSAGIDTTTFEALSDE